MERCVDACRRCQSGDVTSAHPHTMTSASWSSSEEARDERLQQQTPLPLLGNKAPAPVCNGRTLAIDLLQVNKSARSCISTDLSSCLSRFFPNHSLLFCSHRFCFSYLLRSLKATLRVQFFPIVEIVSCARYCPWGREFVSNAVLRNW